MKNKTFAKLFALALTLAALFCLPALAEAAEVTYTVTNEAELRAAVDAANAIVAEANENGTKMDFVNIVVADDIFLTSDLLLQDNLRLRMYGKDGHQYRFTSSAETMEQYVIGYVFAYMGCELEFKDLIFDGGQTGVGFLVLVNATAKLDNVILENFLTNGYMNAVIYSLGLQSTGVPLQLHMTDCIVRNNTCKEYTRPISFLFDDATTSFTRCTFSGNNADSANGTLGLAGDATFTDCTFTNNTSAGGGAIYAVSCDLTVTGSTFTGNKAYYPYHPDGGEGGGALHLKGEVKATISDCTFTGNSSDISGGAVTAFINTVATFTDCEFRNNSAVSHGGAFCVADMFSADDSKASHITLNNCLLQGNKANGGDTSGEHKSDPLAPGGGAIYLHEYCTATLNSGTQLKNNYSAQHGGAVYVSFGGRLTINGAVIENNEAALDGGAIYVDGADHYAGYSHMSLYVPMPDDGFATGGKVAYKQGRIAYNTAGRSGGGVYVGGENEVVVDGVSHVFTGGEITMTGGVITENKAMDMGGGVYVGACDTGDKGGILDMSGGAIYYNVAGENGNTSDGAQDAGADVYSEGGNAYITVVTADEITNYVQSRSNVFVPADHRTLYFTNWYDDYSDQDPQYGKKPDKIGTGTNTGRYKSSKDPDRMVYKPLTQDHAYNALILDYDRLADVPATGDGAPLMLWALLALASMAAVTLLRRRA